MSDSLFYLDELNSEQKKAAMLKNNAVVSAGAGSGKTKVLSKRFVYLVLERKIKIEKILALTFTKKAATEMHDRIYKELCEVKEKLTDKTKKLLAEDALNNFVNANIGTLDSFCSKIARSGCRQFGISPDFTIDQNRANKILKEISRDFFMRHRNDKNIMSLITSTRLEDFILRFFEAFLKYVLVTKPIDIEENKRLFNERLDELFIKNINALDEDIEIILSVDDSNKKDNLLTPLKENILSVADLPKNITGAFSQDFTDLLGNFSKIDLRKGSKKDEFLEARCAAYDIRDVGKEILLLQNTYEKKDLVFAIFDLLAELQQEFITSKISEGVLSYADVAQLAVDCLTNDIDLRNFYKNEYDSIMIDEFQDNNSLQRNLLFLISEKKDLQNKNIPTSDQLVKDKLFFVGDDKQSIYLFRGADVSVFKKLDEEFKSNESASLDINYRTEKGLIVFFNNLFKNVFINENTTDEELSDIDKNVLEHEARFSEINFFRNTENVKPSVNLFIACNNLNDGEEYLTANDAEAFTLAKQILNMVENKVMIRDGQTARPCKFSDFAILFRTTGSQSVVEKHLRQAGIPYKSIQQKGIFTDAPINDLIALIKLALHPNDKFAYTQVLRSPFSKLDDVEVTKILLQNNTNELFVVDENSFESETCVKLKSLNELFFRVKNYTQENTCAEIVSKLWYDEGYRYLILQNENYKRYLELYDYLFEIARGCDASQTSVESFLQLVENYMQKDPDEKLDDMEIPVGFNDNDNTVKLLTIHKSKGLEFPIVCLPFCASTKTAVRLKDKILYSDEYGLSISVTSQDEEGQSKNENVFFNDAKYLANKKETAELRRLLYVALTRAESHIIMTGIKDSRAKNKDKFNFENEEELYYAMCHEFTLEDKIEISFYDLIISAIDENLIENTKEIFHLKEIKPIPRGEFFAKFYDKKHSPINKLDTILNAKVKSFSPAPKKFFTASHLNDNVEKAFYIDDIDGEYKKLLYFDENETENISASELGILTHAAIEARLNNKKFLLPKNEREKILNWCDNFFLSPLGRMATSSEKIKTEYGIITKYKGKTVIGKIDLLFESGGVLYVVDYKTDKYENPDEHKTQLAVYKEACTHLFGKTSDDIKAFVFYLRSGKAVEV